MVTACGLLSKRIKSGETERGLRIRVSLLERMQVGRKRNKGFLQEYYSLDALDIGNTGVAEASYITWQPQKGIWIPRVENRKPKMAYKMHVAVKQPL